MFAFVHWPVNVIGTGEHDCGIGTGLQFLIRDNHGFLPMSRARVVNHERRRLADHLLLRAFLEQRLRRGGTDRLVGIEIEAVGVALPCQRDLAGTRQLLRNDFELADERIARGAGEDGQRGQQQFVSHEEMVLPRGRSHSFRRPTNLPRIIRARYAPLFRRRSQR